MTTTDIDLNWDDHSIRLTFKTPLTHEQRQRLAAEISELFGVRFVDSYESYRLEYDEDNEIPFLAGVEQFDFE